MSKREDKQALTPTLSRLRERGKRKEPRWVVPFLRALERTGEARAAAEDAGIDHTTAYARRKAHGEFAERWAEALRAHAEAKQRAEEEEIASFDKLRVSGIMAPLLPHPSPAEGGGAELVVSGGKVRRVGHGRWNKRKEAIFFDELAATANVKMAAAAAGVSTNAVHARRLRHSLFAAKWEAVEANAKASIKMHLFEETKKSFDPETLETADVQPRVTIDQAIKISQLNASKKPRDELLPDPFAEQAASMSEEDVDELREKLFRKLRRIVERDRPDMIAKGWSLDESWNHMVPPGWIKAADYRPRQWHESREGDGA